MGGSVDPSALSAYVPFSGLDYSGTVITGISGSAIGGQGGTDSATVSAIASAYAESAASSKLDSSAFSSYTATALSGYVPVSAVSSWSSQIQQLSAIVSGLGEIYSLVAGSGVYISSNSSLKQTVIGINGGGGGGISGPVYDLRAGNGLYVSSNSAISATEIGLV